MELNDIPQDKTSGFPAGVSEHTYNTQAECIAFVNGVNLAQDGDVETGTPFERQTNKRFGLGKVTHRRSEWVVRVKVGEWNDEEDDNPPPVNFDTKNYLDVKVQGQPVIGGLTRDEE